MKARKHRRKSTLEMREKHLQDKTSELDDVCRINTANSGKSEEEIRQEGGASLFLGFSDFDPVRKHKIG